MCILLDCPIGSYPFCSASDTDPGGNLHRSAHDQHVHDVLSIGNAALYPRTNHYEQAKMVLLCFSDGSLDRSIGNQRNCRNTPAFDPDVRMVFLSGLEAKMVVTAPPLDVSPGCFIGRHLVDVSRHNIMLKLTKIKGFSNDFWTIGKHFSRSFIYFFIAQTHQKIMLPAR